MRYEYLLLFLIFIILLLIYKGSQKPKIYRNVSQNEIRRFLLVLLFRGYYTGIMNISYGKENFSILFSKYKERKETGINLCFPIDIEFDYTEKDIKNLLEKENLDYYTETTEEKLTPKYFVINMSQNIVLAEKLFKKFFQEFYKFGVNELVNIHFDRIAPFDTFIGVDNLPKPEININIPTTNGGYWAYNIGSFFGKLFKVFRI